MKKYYNPISGEQLMFGMDGLLHSDYVNTLFAIGSNDQVIPLKDPLNGADLYYDKKGNLVSDNTSYYCALIKGKIIPLKDPISNDDLILNADGILSNKVNDNLYYFNEEGEIVNYNNELENINKKR